MIFRSVREASRDTLVFSGRSERLEHWAFLLFTGMCAVVIQIIANQELLFVFPINWIVLVFGAWLSLANVSLMVRRFHDHDLSGLWLLIVLIPGGMMLVAGRELFGSGTVLTLEQGELLFKMSQAGMLSVLILFGSLFVRPGSKKDNRYGPPVA